ncbi:MAG: amino acid permease [Candidatus Omnitrophica bacterium]|nr:amino acid permease [Candidatus Omnitrophota bacterium]
MEDKRLKKDLGLASVFCIATGAMISSGLFLLPGLAHAKAGPAVVLSYLIAGLFAMTGMLSQAELVSAMPKAGGTYFYVARSMGPALGTIDGILTWMSISLKSSFALMGMAAFTQTMVGMDIRLIGLVLCVVFIILNIIGIRQAGMVQVGLVVFLFVLLTFYTVKGLTAINVAHFSDPIPHGITSIFSTAGFVFISYGGLIKVASIAEEVKQPTKTVPMGMILSLLAVSLLYTLTVFVTSGVLGAEQLDHSLTPISDGAAVFMGDNGRIAMSAAAILAFISTANAGIMSASRYPLALSRDGLIPETFGSISEKFKTPVKAIVLTGVVMIMALFLDLNLLVKLASTVLIMTFIFSCICVIIMRESGVENYRPRFRAPLYPWIQLVGIFGCWLLVVNMGKAALLLGSVFFAGGLAVYWFYGKERARRDYALLHLIERAAASEFADVSLETELRDILKERYETGKDRFDKIIEECSILDIEEEMDRDSFFKLVAERMAERLGTDSKELFDLLLKREREASTVMSPGLAIPHIIIEGQNRLLILMARARKGIRFPEEEEKVHTVFVIMGTIDERSFHLRVLSAIAQIVEEHDFKRRWMNARDEKELRDIILFAKRKR